MYICVYIYIHINTVYIFISEMAKIFHAEKFILNFIPFSKLLIKLTLLAHLGHCYIYQEDCPLS